MNRLHSIVKKTEKLRYSLMFTMMKYITPSMCRKVRGFPRGMTRFLAEYFKDKPLIGVEIGVASGNHAKNILETLHIEKLFLIDPYTPYLENGKTVARYVNYFEIAQKKLRRFQNIQFIRKKSYDAIDRIPSDLDFVYIDGNHSYKSVEQDIAYYYPKLEKGGILGGHDFTLEFKGVVKACLEFVDEHYLELNGSRSDWWVIKKRGLGK